MSLKDLSGVADVVAKIMAEQLKGNQKAIDKNHNGKVDGQDFAILRGEKKAIKEEDAYDKDRYAVKNGKAVKDNPAHMGSKDEPHHVWAKSADEALKKKMKEDVELEEGIEDRLEAARAKAKAAGKPIKDKPTPPKSNVRKIEGSAYGGARQKDEPEDDDDTTMKSTKKGTFKRRYNTKTYSEMIAAYREDGLKALLVTEEPTNDEYTAEVKAAQAKSEGKGKKAEVGKGAVQAVKTEETHTKVEVLDFNDINGEIGRAHV